MSETYVKIEKTDLIKGLNKIRLGIAEALVLNIVTIFNKEYFINLKYIGVFDRS